MMQQEIRFAIDTLLSGGHLSPESVQQAIGAIMDGRCSEVETAALLTAMALRGETEDDLIGAASAMRTRAARIPTRQTKLIDTCGTGGDRLHTFNISTATALVIAGTGIPVAKHGNRSVSSSSGSADVLETLGVNIDITPEQAGQCLDEIGICFCYARTCHTAMKHVAAVRAQLGFRTLFNLLGPLTNPARAEFQLLGTLSAQHAALIAKAAARLGVKRAFIVCGNGQLDEVALWGSTQVWDVHAGSTCEATWTAQDFGLPECQPEELKVSSASESATIVSSILEGESGPARNIVLANAAAALLCRGDVDSLSGGVARAAAAIDDGSVRRKLDQLVDWTARAATP